MQIFSLYFILSLFLAAVMSFMINRLLIRHADKLMLLDHPNHRSSHYHPIPKGGGLGIVLGFMTASLLYGYLGVTDYFILSFFLSATIMAAVGFYDDHQNSSPLFRLIVQMLLVGNLLFTLYFGAGLSAYFHLSPWTQIIFLVFFFISGIWTVNFYNFMDGINGFVAMETLWIILFASCTLSKHPNLSYLYPYLFFLFAAVIGFVYWNFFRSAIFMGDTGSLFLGFMITGFAYYTIFTRQIHLSLWLLWLSPFWVDATYTLLTRIRDGHIWHEAHRTYLFQKLSISLNSHTKVVLLLSIYNLIWITPLSYINIHFDSYKVEYLTLFFAALPILGLALKFKAGRANG